jgi:Zn-finger nucleic acid-binding protein
METEPMKCPIDDTALVMSDRQGIEIDYCPKCRGVWLDRGELDKIIERSLPQAAPPPPQAQAQAYDAPPPRFAERPREYDDRDYRREADHHNRKPYKKRESFLSDIFDF